MPPAAIPRALEGSLRRLGMERVDLFQLHNLIGATPSADQVSSEVVPALERLREQGKLRFYGITALGDTAALHRVVGSGRIDTAQVCYNLLDPSAGEAVPAGFPAQDFDRLLDRAGQHQARRHRDPGARRRRAQRLGVRHPVAVPAVEPIASGPDYATDVRRAQALDALVSEGHAGSLVEAALRFPLGHAAVSTVLLGYSSLEHLEAAAGAVARGPLPAAGLARLKELWTRMR